MHIVPLALSLLATTTAVVALPPARILHYKVPNEFRVLAEKECTFPANFVVSNFTTYTDGLNSNLNTLHFEFSDADTGIHAVCTRNVFSKALGPGENRYACDDKNINFIYESGGLTLIERACPGTSSSAYEASGLVTPDLKCTNTTIGAFCGAKQQLDGIYGSFEPVPPGVPA